MKKIISTILAAALILGTIIPGMTFSAFADGNATSFSDDFTTTDNWTGATGKIFTSVPGFGSNASGNEDPATITTNEQYDLGSVFDASFDLNYKWRNGALNTKDANGFYSTGLDYYINIGLFKIEIRQYQNLLRVYYNNTDIMGTSVCYDSSYYTDFTRNFKVHIEPGNISIISYQSGVAKVEYTGDFADFVSVNDASISITRNESWQIQGSYLKNFSVRKNITEFSDDFSSDENWTGDTTYINAEKGFGESKEWSNATKTVTAKEHLDLGTEFDSSFKIYTYYSNGNAINTNEDWQITIGDFKISVCDFQTRLKVYYKGSNIGGEYVCSNSAYSTPRTLTYLVHIEPGNISITSATLSYTSDFEGFIPQNDAAITLKKNTTWHIHTTYLDDFFVRRNRNSFVADFTSDSQWIGTQGSGTGAINTSYGWFGSKPNFNGATSGWDNSTATITSKSAFYFGDVVDADFSIYMQYANGSYYDASGLKQANTDFIIGIGDFQIGICDYQTRITVSYNGSNIGGTSTCSDYTYRTDFTRNYEVHIEKGCITVQSSKVSYFSSFDDFDAINNAKVSLKLNETWQLPTDYISSFTVSGKKDSIFGYRTQSLSLSDNEIGVNFYLDLSGVPEAQKTDSYMTFEIADYDGATDTVYYDGLALGSNGVYSRFAVPINPALVTKTITPTFHYDSGASLVGESFTVQDYVDYIAANSGSFSSDDVDYAEELGDYIGFIETIDLTDDGDVDICDLVQAEMNSVSDSETYNDGYLSDLCQVIMEIYNYLGDAIEETIQLPEIVLG